MVLPQFEYLAPKTIGRRAICSLSLKHSQGYGRRNGSDSANERQGYITRVYH